VRRGYSEARSDLDDNVRAMKSSSFIEKWKRGKAHKSQLQCFALQLLIIQPSVNQECIDFEGIQPLLKCLLGQFARSKFNPELGSFFTSANYR